ncbi:MAG: aminodeoxychorismate/anthranilate synthase component II [Xanthomonadales bacterium]|nr:aminodeoxychorismate/anthranilate synthase component II [Gammaproteobacteria bacterium]MBT8072834.1 aminodeoxychorismate/anthranilate synthase component II [Gammaproteobacteria bacterium]NNK03676.1 aminodeoxychorismate/anthranilate synthase component II [Xanthomonadales bacterium]NNK98465.1 aminodeoxychorismate/anthranilate synthase component II [Xanthomonadales bacterium]
MILMIDNYDSFTYNLVQYLGELGADVKTVRNDAITTAGIRDLNPQGIVISPGPCTPDDAGISLAIVAELGDAYPILGVCLGHQCIGQVFGGKVVRADKVMHGKTSMMHHRGEGVFAGLPQPFEATRYHSLVLQKDAVPACLEVTAWTEKDNGEIEEIMGLKHVDLPIEGVQFHPESILTRCGHDLLQNFINTTRQFGAGREAK